jgi:hypothetical protein
MKSNQNLMNSGIKYERERREPSGWKMDARLMTLLCKQITVTKSKGAKTNLTETSKKRCCSKRAVLPMMLMMKMTTTTTMMMMKDGTK